MDATPLDEPAVIICNDARGLATFDVFSGHQPTRILFIHPEERWIAFLRYDRSQFLQFSGPPLRVLSSPVLPTRNPCDATSAPQSEIPYFAAYRSEA